jgi:hypothetical protein
MPIQKQKIILIVCSFLAIFSFSLAPVVSQARGLVPCGGYSDNNGTREKPCTVEDIFSLVAKVTNFLIGIAGIYAVYEIINAGFWLIVSSGREESITKYKTALSNAIVGFVLVLMSYMLINTVVNVLLTRSLVTNNPNCKLDLTQPLTYLTIKDTSQCSSVQPDSSLHTGQ